MGTPDTKKNFKILQYAIMQMKTEKTRCKDNATEEQNTLQRHTPERWLRRENFKKSKRIHHASSGTSIQNEKYSSSG